MLNDAELLDRYALHRDEDAFAELVKRHLNLVYSAAIRQMGGDVHSAQDVTQSVFVNLAGKAGALLPGLREAQPLVGWLYTSTLYAARRLRRTDQRRLHRDHAAYTMNRSVDSTIAVTVPPWSDVRRLLDEAMSGLSSIDRDAVLLRYFEGRELRGVGAELGGPNSKN